MVVALLKAKKVLTGILHYVHCLPPIRIYCLWQEALVVLLTGVLFMFIDSFRGIMDFGLFVINYNTFA